MEQLSQVDRWFLEVGIILLGAYFLWSIRRVLTDFTGQVADLKTLIGKLFDRDDNHERRISRLEGNCHANHRGGKE